MRYRVFSATKLHCDIKKILGSQIEIMLFLMKKNKIVIFNEVWKFRGENSLECVYSPFYINRNKPPKIQVHLNWANGK